jgi:CheY-like chemotaxis protein
MAVETARNGEEALAWLGTGKRPELVLLDLMMPVTNGREFLEAAKDISFKGLPSWW